MQVMCGGEIDLPPHPSWAVAAVASALVGGGAGTEGSERGLATGARERGR